MDNRIIILAGSILQIESKRFGSGYKPEPAWKKGEPKEKSYYIYFRHF
jgi:hypothetical protein